MTKRVRKLKPTVTIIGAGRLGTALAIELSRNGYQIGYLIGRRTASIKRSAALLDVPVQLLAAKEISRLKVSGLIIIATPDDQIRSVVESLSDLEAGDGQPTVLHTSGALSSAVLKPLAGRGWATGSIHPLVSVSDPLKGAQAFRGAFWCVEGDRRASHLSRRLITDLSGHSFTISQDNKPLYHAAAVMSSGNIVALFDVAIDMLCQSGLNRGEARRILLPLLRSTTENLSERSPAKALTGTFARGDILTVERHLGALSKQELKDALALYRLLGHKALELAERNGLEPGVSQRIADRLAE